MICKLIKYLMYFILTLIHFIIFAHEGINYKRYLDEPTFKQDIPIQTIPLRMTLFSPYTDIDVSPGEEGATVKNYFLLGLLYSRTDYLSGVSISPISDIRENMYGLQLSFVNFVDGELAGVQLGSANFANNVWGIQLGFSNVSSDVNGAQGALVNIADNINGAQVGMANIADDINGAQVGIANIADNTDGAQVGYYSQTNDVLRGFQIGIVNYANNVKGVQIGLINYANERTGESFGFMSFLLKTGQTKLSLWYDSYFPLNIALKAGTKYFYSKAQVSAYPDASNFFDLAFGTGAQYPFKPIWLGAEFVLMETKKQNTDIRALRAQYTLLFGTTIKHDYDLFMGISYNSPEIMNQSEIKDLIPNCNYFVSASLGIQYLIKGVPNW
jgi:hypothetical protein